MPLGFSIAQLPEELLGAGVHSFFEVADLDLIGTEVKVGGFKIAPHLTFPANQLWP